MATRRFLIIFGWLVVILRCVGVTAWSAEGATQGGEWRYDVEEAGDYGKVGFTQYRPGRPCWHESFPLSCEFVTPHLKWGKPYSQGPVKTLILYNHLRCRQIVELAQRIELKFTTLCFTCFRGKAQDQPPAYVLESLQDKEMEVILISGFSPKFFSRPELAKALKERVASGAGLVLIDPRIAGTDAEFLDLAPILKESKDIPYGKGKWRSVETYPITAGVPLETLPSSVLIKGGAIPSYTLTPQSEVLADFQGVPIIAVRHYGKGRVVALGFQTGGGLIPTTAEGNSEKYGYWECLYSLVGRAVYWAAGKEPSLLLQRFQAPGSVTVQNGGKAFDGSLRWALRSPWAGVCFRGSRAVRLEPGEANVPLELPKALGGGQWFLDVHLLKDGNVAGWGSFGFRREPSFSLSNISLDKDSLAPGENLKGKIEWTGQGKENRSVRLSVYDAYRRKALVEEKAVAQGAEGGVAFDLALGDFMTTAGRVEIDALAETLLQDRKELSFTVMQNPTPRDYEIYYWPWSSSISHTEHTEPYFLELIRRLAHVDGFYPTLYPEFYARQGFKIFPRARLDCLTGLWDEGDIATFYQRSYAETRDKKFLIRKPCISDPAVRQGFLNTVRNSVRNCQRFSPMGYDLGDEQALTMKWGYYGYRHPLDFCFSEHCLKRFREWLKSEYGNIETLNREWDTSFAQWEDVVPLTLVEAREKEKENFASWSDHRSFNDWNLAGLLEEGNAIARELGSQARFAMSGTQMYTGENGCEWGRLFSSDSLGFHAAYSVGNTDEIRLGLGRRHGLKWAGWSGYTIGKGSDYSLWAQLFHGDCGTCVFMVIDHFGLDFTCKMGDRQLNFYRELERIKYGGFGKLCQVAERDNLGIAVYYSPRSVQWGLVERDCYHLGSMVEWERLLEIVGYQFEVIDRQDLKTIFDKFRVLVLPSVVSLADEEAESIREFVKRGGIVISGPFAGELDGHCKRRPKGALEDALGLRLELTERGRNLIKKGDEAEEAGATYRMDGKSRVRDFPIKKKVTAGRFLYHPVGRKVVPLSAKVLAEDNEGQPLLCENTFGKGKVLFFNGNLLSPGRDTGGSARITGEGIEGIPAWDEQLSRLFAQAQLSPRVRIADEKGQLFDGMETVYYRLGKSQYVGILSRPVDKGKASSQALEMVGLVSSIPEGSESPARVRFAQSGHMYDLLGNGYLGEGQEIKTKFKVADYRFYGLLPYKVEGIELAVGKSARLGESLPFSIQIKAGGNELDTHIVCFEVWGPDEKRRPYYCSRLVASSGKANGTIAFAWNDAIGRWRITAKEVASGVRSEVAVVLGE